MSLALLFHYLMFNVFQMLIHPSSEACDLFVELFHGLYWSGSMCVGVTLWFGCGGVASVCRLKQLLQPAYAYHTTTAKPQRNTKTQALAPQPAYGYHTTTAKPQRNTNTHRTRAIQPMK